MSQNCLSILTIFGLAFGLTSAIKTGKSLSGKDGILTPIIKRALETALEGEMQHYLSESKKEEDNRKNGKSKKTVRSAYGDFELETPRDRNGGFEPESIMVPGLFRKSE